MTAAAQADARLLGRLGDLLDAVEPVPANIVEAARRAFESRATQSPAPAGGTTPGAARGITITVYGTPAGQGRITFLGAGRGAKHSNEETLKPWRKAIVTAALEATGWHRFAEFRPGLCAICKVPKRQHALLVGIPVHADITITVPKPKTAPKRTRSWPITRYSTDIDHHARACLDALSEAGVFLDDSQVVRLTISKGYPGEDVGTLDRPGAVITVRPFGGGR